MRRVRLSQIKKAIAGKTVIVLGSAPEPELPESTDLKQAVFVCANASHRNIPSGLTDNHVITIADLDFLQEDTFNENHLESRRGFSLLQNHTIVGLQSNPNTIRGLKLAPGFERCYAGYIGVGLMRRILIQETRSFVVGSFPWGLPSTGAKCAVLALHLGASEVWLAGIRVTIQSAYDHGGHKVQDSPVPFDKVASRNHSTADSLIFASLTCRGRQIRSKEADLEFLLSNFHLSEPHWVHDRRLVTKLFFSILNK